jgi:hypothetical protein
VPFQDSIGGSSRLHHQTSSVIHLGHPYIQRDEVGEAVLLAGSEIEKAVTKLGKKTNAVGSISAT